TSHNSTLSLHDALPISELDAHRDARGPDRDGGVPEHPAPALAAAAHHARHRDCARRPHRYLLWRERHRATPHSQSGDPQPAALRSEEHTSELQSPYDLV